MGFPAAAGVSSFRTTLPSQERTSTFLLHGPRAKVQNGNLAAAGSETANRHPFALAVHGQGVDRPALFPPPVPAQRPPRAPLQPRRAHLPDANDLVVAGGNQLAAVGGEG